jgi:hypothetical protein
MTMFNMAKVSNLSDDMVDLKYVLILRRVENYLSVEQLEAGVHRNIRRVI